MKEDYNIKYIEIGETYYNKFVKRKRYTIEEFKNEFILKSQKKKRIPKIRIFEVLKFFEKIIDKILGATLKIKYAKIKPENSEGNSGNNYIEKLGQKIPLVKTIVDVFDGEIVG